MANTQGVKSSLSELQNPFANGGTPPFCKSGRKWLLFHLVNQGVFKAPISAELVKHIMASKKGTTNGGAGLGAAGSVVGPEMPAGESRPKREVKRSESRNIA